MKSERKRMIISEIKYWQRNNLLPSHYCDFLISLYSEGESGGKVERVTKPSVLEREKKDQVLLKIGLVLFVLINIGILFLTINYESITLVVTFFSFFGILTYTAYRTISRRDVNAFLYLLCALLLLAISFKLWSILFMGNSIILLALLLLNCAIWIVVGMSLKMLYFTLAGTLSIIFIVLYIFING